MFFTHIIEYILAYNVIYLQFLRMLANCVVYPTPLIKSYSVERKSFPSFSNVFLLQNHYSQTRLVLDNAIWNWNRVMYLVSMLLCETKLVLTSTYLQ